MTHMHKCYLQEPKNMEQVLYVSGNPLDFLQMQFCDEKIYVLIVCEQNSCL
jgi:hypothetical protein